MSSGTANLWYIGITRNVGFLSAQMRSCAWRRPEHSSVPLKYSSVVIANHDQCYVDDTSSLPRLVKIHLVMATRTTITSQDIADGNVRHYADYLKASRCPSFKVVIPTLDRPEQLCLTTLTLLRSHGFPLSNIGVLITAMTMDIANVPQGSRYLE